MTFNESTWERVIRILVGVALAYTAWLTWPGAIGIALLVIATLALVTGLVGWCPAYALCKASTRKQVGA